jgi:Fe-S-cluster containining protein
MNIIKDEAEFERLKPQHFFYSWLNIVGNGETGLIFECTKLDKEKGVCTAYKQRASICRNYPQEEVFEMGGIISDDCGYKFVPIKSFEEVFNKIKKSQDKT